MKNKELKRKYLEFQILIQQVNQIQEQINTINNNVLELKNLVDNLDYIKNIKKDKDVLIPVGSNIFLKGTLKKPEDIIIGIGSNILKEKTIPQSQETINEQIKELEKISFELDNNLKIYIKKLEDLENDITKSEKEK